MAPSGYAAGNVRRRIRRKISRRVADNIRQAFATRFMLSPLPGASSRMVFPSLALPCVPLRMPIHWRADSIRTRATISTRTAVTAASRRLLKMRRAVRWLRACRESVRLREETDSRIWDRKFCATRR